MVRVHFNPARTENYNYTTSNYIKASAYVNGVENEFTYTNQARTQMKMRINLKSILGAKHFNENKIFSIKLNDIKTIFENGIQSDSVNTVSPAWFRTSNMVLSGANFLGGRKEIIMGQISNFDPNLETSFNLEFHRPDLQYLGEYTLYFRGFNGGLANWDGYEFMRTFIEPFSNVSYRNYDLMEQRRFRWNYREQDNYNNAFTDTNPSLENKVIYFTDCAVAQPAGWLLCNYRVIGEDENIQRTGSNFPITLTAMPQNNAWYMMKRNDFLPNDEDFGIEAWFHKPVGDYIDLTIEIRDILTDQLQPIRTNAKVIPPLTFVFDIN